MRQDITPETVAQHIYEGIICPSGNPRADLMAWMDQTSGLGCILANWQRVAQGRPGYEDQTAVLTKALLQAQDIMRCLARVA